MVEYVKDMTVARVESHHMLSRPGICEKAISMTP
jgi:hypothetical protein